MRKKLYEAINAMLARLGADGQITPMAPEVGDVMAEMALIDGGVYNPAFNGEEIDVRWNTWPEDEARAIYEELKQIFDGDAQEKKEHDRHD